MKAICFLSCFTLLCMFCDGQTSLVKNFSFEEIGDPNYPR